MGSSIDEIDTRQTTPTEATRLNVVAKVMAVVVLAINILELPAYIPGISPVPLPAWVIALGLTAAGLTILSATLVLRRRRLGARLAWLAVLLQLAITVTQVSVYALNTDALLDNPMIQGQIAQEEIDPELLDTFRTIVAAVLVGLLGLMGIVRVAVHVLYAVIVNRPQARATYLA